MANLKEAFEYASQNPDSDFARNLEQLASTGSLNKEAERFGIDLSPFQPKKTLVNKLGERAKTFASEATLKPSRDILVQGAGTTGLERELTGAESMNRALQSPIRAVGAVGGAIGDVFGAGLEATGLDEPIAQAIQPIVQSEPIQKAIQAFQTLPKETQDVLGAIMNTANIPLTGVGAGVVKTGLETGANILKPVAETTGKLLSKTTPSEAQAISNTYKGIMDIVENKKSLLNNFKKSEGSGKDPISIVAENPDYMVRINPEAKTIDASDSITNMRRDIADFSTVRDSLLETADELLPPIPTNKIIQDTLNKFSAKNYSTYLDEGEKAVKDIVTKLQTLQKYNPQTISRIELNNIRKGLDETINSFTDTKLKDRMRTDLRKVFKSNLEDSIPESGLLSNLNAKIGDLMDASSFLEKNLNGTKVKGGGLTDLAMKATGASIGATGLGGAFGGIPGAAAGYLMSDFLSKTLIKNAINNPFDRAILEKLKSVRPDVVKRAEDYIKTSQPTSKPTSTGQKELLEKLPSQPNTTPTPPKGKGVRGMIDFDEIMKSLIPTKKLVAEAKDAVDELEATLSYVDSTKSPQAVKDLRKELADLMTSMGRETVITNGNYKTVLQEADDMLNQLKAHIKNSEAQASNDVIERRFIKNPITGKLEGSSKKKVVSEVPKTKVISPLEQEAKKYKSAEEFASSDKHIIDRSGELVKVGDKVTFARGGSEFNGKLVKVKNFDGSYDVTSTKGKDFKDYSPEVVVEATEDVYNKGGFPIHKKGDRFDVSMYQINEYKDGYKPVKTKTQLTDIWKKANKK